MVFISAIFHFPFSIFLFDMLSKTYNPENKFEIGVDEAGRGPLFGRLYVAAVVLGDIDNPDIKDSKKIKSQKKMEALSDYIKEHAAAWAIQYIEHDVIDEINIRQSVFRGMHECIKQVVNTLQLSVADQEKTFLLIDGNDFAPVYLQENKLLRYTTVEGGDNKYMAIAAASILAKCARDEYIRGLCSEYPDLSDRYKIDRNMGYGTKAHLEGILEHGITQWHRKTYARCNTAKYSPV
jgi:ribonuclease HII